MTRARAVSRAARAGLSALSVLSVCAALASASCSAPLMKRMTLPSGPGVSVVPPDAAEQALKEATAACRGMQTITAEVGVAGSVGGHRTPSGHLIVALAAPASARIEAPAPFGPLFIFVARDADANLVLVRDNRVLEHGPPAAVLEALTGVPLDAADLRTMLTGCAVAADASAGAAARRRLDDDAGRDRQRSTCTARSARTRGRSRAPSVTTRQVLNGTRSIATSRTVWRDRFICGRATRDASTLACRSHRWRSTCHFRPTRSACGSRGRRRRSRW